MQPDVLRAGSDPMVWLIAGVMVSLVVIQAVLYTRAAFRTASAIDYPRDSCIRALRAGIISAIGPSVSVMIVMVGMMAVVGSPMSWLRLAVIGAPPTEMTAATVGAEAYGVKFGGADYNLNALATSWWTMAVNGFGWLAICAVFTHRLEALRTKVGGGDAKWLALLSGAAMLGAFSYLISGHLIAGGGRLVAVVSGAISMVVLLNLARQWKPLKEYTLGLAMIIGMIIAAMLS